MATNYPGAIDSFTNPTSGDTLDSPSHAAQHANVNDAMVAVQTKLGVGSGTIGTWTAFTPSWFNLTVGNGVQDFRYCLINDFIAVDGTLTFGSTTSITGSSPGIFPPVGTFAGDANGLLWTRDNSAGATRIGSVIVTNNLVRTYYHTVSGSLINIAGVTSTAPFTYATGDYLRFSIVAQIS